MKQKDLTLIIIVVFFSVIISLFVSKAIFASPKNRQQEVDIVQPISSAFPQPDNRYFNSTTYDPTQVITISPNNNTNPFANSSSSSQ